MKFACYYIVGQQISERFGQIVKAVIGLIYFEYQIDNAQNDCENSGRAVVCRVCGGRIDQRLFGKIIRTEVGL